MTIIDESALLAAIRSNPADDAPRLIYADWLDENGESAHAELIRVQCELDKLNSLNDPVKRWNTLRRRERELLSNIADIFTDMPEGWTINLGDGTRYSDHSENTTSYEVKIVRGFVSHVSAPFATLVGGQCKRCSGYGVVRLPINHSDYMRRTSAECDYCFGTGRTNGILPKIVRSRCAVIELVSVTNKSPLFFHSRYHWRLDGVGQYQINDRHDIDIKIWWDHQVNGFNSFSTADDANIALSTALIRWAWSIDAKESAGTK